LISQKKSARKSSSQKMVLDKPVVAVIGATGCQGGSVVRALVENGSFQVRIVTRNPSSPKAKELMAQGAQIAKANVYNLEELENAFRDAAFVYGLSDFYDKDSIEKAKQTGDFGYEFEQGKNIADAAKACNVQLLVWSTLENVKERSNGKYRNTFHFDKKNEVEQYIRRNDMPAAFIEPALFLHYMLELFSTRADDGVLELRMNFAPDKRIHVIDAHRDIGPVVLSLLKNPDRYKGCIVPIAVETSMNELVQAYKKATGEELRYIQIPADEIRLDPKFNPVRQELAEMLKYIEEFEYYDVSRYDFNLASKLAGRPLTTPFEFFHRWQQEKKQQSQGQQQKHGQSSEQQSQQQQHQTQMESKA